MRVQLKTARKATTSSTSTNQQRSRKTRVAGRGARPGTSRGPRYWCGVVSREHIMIGVSGGFCQVGHGKRAPLARMAAGDGIVFYSPVLSFGGKEKCQRFTAIGRISGESVYQVEMTPSFKPYRRAVQYFKCQEVDIRPLLDELEVTKGRSNWGYMFRMGHFALPEEDFLKIARAMLPRTWSEAFPGKPQPGSARGS